MIIRTLSAICLALALPSAAFAVKGETLSQSTKSWNGALLEYPIGQAELSIVKVTIEPGDVLDFHCHPVPSAAYVLSGELEVALKDGNTKRFRTADTITEVVSTMHKGTNLSDKEPVVLIVFYAGAEGQPISLHGKDAAAHCPK